MRPANSVFGNLGTTIFSVMSALAAEHGAINLGQGFPDDELWEDTQSSGRQIRETLLCWYPGTGDPTGQRFEIMRPENGQAPILGIKQVVELVDAAQYRAWHHLE